MFRAAIECVEESVISSLTHAEHTKGFRGHEKNALPSCCNGGYAGPASP